MPHRTVTTEEFQRDWQRLFDEINRDDVAVTVVRDGIPVARLDPLAAKRRDKPLIGSMAGSVLRYDDPFAPAEDANVWHASR